MDLSKLPRLSNSASPAPSSPPVAETPLTQPPAVAPPANTGVDAVGIGADIWFMSIVGLILIFLGRDFIRYEFDVLSHRTFHTNTTWESGPKEGQEVAYPELMGFTNIAGDTYYTHSCLVLFGLTMIVDGIGRALASSRLPGRRGILAATLFITLATIIYNFLVAAKYLAAGALPVVSGLAIAFGGYLAFFQWAMLQSMRSRRA